MDNEKEKNPRQRRHRFTINNPIVTDDVKILKPDEMTDEQKELYKKPSQPIIHLSKTTKN